MSEHRTRVERIPDEGWQLICSCGWVGQVREKEMDAGEDEIAHHHTGGGPRTFDEIRAEEESESYLGKVGAAIRKLRPIGGGFRRG